MQCKLLSGKNHGWNIRVSTVEPRYNEVLGTMKITLLYQVSHYIRVKKQRNIKSWDQQNYLVNPILTGLFESKFLLGGGSIWPPLQISAPKGPIAAKFCMDVKTHLKSIATNFFLPKTVYLLYYYNLCKWDAC